MARSFCTPNCDNYSYPILGIYEELAELIEKSPISYASGWQGIKARITMRMLVFVGKRLGKWAKAIRKGKKIVPMRFKATELTGDNVKGCFYELGDIHWMLANIDAAFLFTSESVEDANITKLSMRKLKGQIIDHPDN